MGAIHFNDLLGWDMHGWSESKVINLMFAGLLLINIPYAMYVELSDGL